MTAALANRAFASLPGHLTAALPAADLEQVERILTRTFAGYPASFGPVLSHLRHYRGKRLRPLLLLLVGHACGKISPAHPVLGAALEMIHTATLVHDDVLDEAAIRRHVETVNARWGNKVSILLGDMLFTHAFHLTSTLGDARACEWIGEATNAVCAGELCQNVEQGNLALPEEGYFGIIEGKTAALTEAACRLGAFYAGAGPERVDAMAEYGRCLGIAFQIADDLLDLVGLESSAGKTLGTDLKQRKLTLPLIHALAKLSGPAAEELRRHLRSENPDRERVGLLLNETDSLGYARRTAESYSQRALRATDELPRSPQREMLRQLTDWSIRRDR